MEVGCEAEEGAGTVCELRVGVDSGPEAGWEWAGHELGVG